MKEVMEILSSLLTLYSSTVTYTKKIPILLEAFYTVTNAKYFSCVSIHPIPDYILAFQTKDILAKKLN